MHKAYDYDNSTVNLRIESNLPVIITTTADKNFMTFITKVIKERVLTLISRFYIPQIPTQLVNQLGVEKEATSTN